jgi:hypothetical protein
MSWVAQWSWVDSRQEQEILLDLLLDEQRGFFPRE